MTEVPSCVDQCSNTSPAPISLAEAEARFRRGSERGTCDTGRYRCSYYVWGQGPPLLLIPGLADEAMSFLFLAAQLAGAFRCVAYDLPTGRGDGARLGRYTHDDLRADARALLDHLGISQAYVLGSSFGSTIALALARACPERIPRLILQGGFACRPLARTEVLLARVARYWPGSLRLLPGRLAILHRCHHGPFSPRPAEIWEYFLDRSNHLPIKAFAYRAVMLHGIDLQSILPQVRQPVLLVCGDDDPLVGKPCEDILLRGLPNAVRAELTCCGHNPLFTHPEVMAELCRGFLTPKTEGTRDGQATNAPPWGR
jgi:pimeloyl-ACP methyl ester carboxylesterase